jgi:hypothetical protein
VPNFAFAIDWAHCRGERTKRVSHHPSTVFQLGLLVNRLTVDHGERRKKLTPEFAMKGRSTAQVIVPANLPTLESSSFRIGELFALR